MYLDIRAHFSQNIQAHFFHQVLSGPFFFGSRFSWSYFVFSFRRTSDCPKTPESAFFGWSWCSNTYFPETSSLLSLVKVAMDMFYLARTIQIRNYYFWSFCNLDSANMTKAAIEFAKYWYASWYFSKPRSLLSFILVPSENFLFQKSIQLKFFWFCSFSPKCDKVLFKLMYLVIQARILSINRTWFLQASSQTAGFYLMSTNFREKDRFCSVRLKFDNPKSLTNAFNIAGSRFFNSSYSISWGLIAFI